MLDETELCNNLSFNQSLAESNIDKIDIKSPLEHQIQKQEMKVSGWSFDENISRTI